MKYQININQAGVVAAGLEKDTDLTDWAILSHVYAWQANKKAHRMGDLVWISFGKLMEEMPLMGINSKPTISRRLDKLETLGLLETHQSDDKRLFACTTERYQEIHEYHHTTQRKGRYREVTGVTEKQQGVTDGQQGGVTQKQHSIDNHISTVNHNRKASGPDGPGAEAPPTDLFGGKPPPKQPDTLTKDARSQMWQMGVSLLTNQGLSDSTARALIGKLAKQGEKKLAGVIGECAVKPPADARAYITAAMQNAYNLYDEAQLRAAAKAYGVPAKQNDSFDSWRERVREAMRGGVAA